MWKWFTGFAVVVIAIVLMTCKDQNSTEKAKGQGKEQGIGLAIPAIDKSQATDYSQESSDCPPCWHKLVAWPEGITAWAILATLFAIAYQSVETAKAANAANRSIQVTMDADRGLLLVDWDDLTCLDELPKPVEEWRPSFVWNVRDVGKSPVFLIEYSDNFIMLGDLKDLSEDPVYSAPNVVLDEPITAEKRSGPFVTTLKTDLPYPEIEPTYRLKKGVMYVYGYVKYLDIYRRLHTTRFGLEYRAWGTPKRDYDGFRMGGPAKYNEHT